MQSASNFPDALPLEELRAALRDAIRAREWRSVEIVQAQIDAIERVDVIALDEERAKRGR